MDPHPPDRYDSRDRLPEWADHDLTEGAGADDAPAPSGLAAIGIHGRDDDPDQLVETRRYDTDPGPAPDEPPVRIRHRFRAWRRSRPFWAAVLMLLGGAEIELTVHAPIKVIVHLGAQGLAGEAIPIVMMVCAVLLLVSPDQRLFYAIIGLLASLASWVTSNLGGFIFGLVLGLVGACWAVAWTPLADLSHKARPRRGLTRGRRRLAR